MMYNVKTGKTYTIDDVSDFSIVNKEGKEIRNIPVEHDTRSLLNLVNKGLFSDYDYMPVTSKDIAQGVAAGIEANSGTYAIMKLIGTAAGAGAGMPGLGFMLSNLGVEIYETAKQVHMSGSPKEFWNDFVGNVQTIAEDRDSAFMSFLDGAGIGSSYFAKGAHESLYKDWDDTLQENGWYGFGDFAGNIVRMSATIAAFGGSTAFKSANAIKLAGISSKLDLTKAATQSIANVASWSRVSSGLITDFTLVDGLEDMGARLGNGKEVWESAGLATLNGLASGAAGAFTLKAIPAFARLAAPKLVSAFENSGMINALGNGAENALWYKMRNDLASVATGEEYETDPMTTAMMFGGGFLLSGIAHKLSGRGLQKEANDTFNPLQIEYSNADKRNALRSYCEKGDLQIEYSNADRRNALRSYYEKGAFDNTAKVLRKEEAVALASALAARDRIMMTNHPSYKSFEDATQKEYFNQKNLHFWRDSIRDVGSNYKQRLDVNPEGWKMSSLMQRSTMKNTGEINMSKAAGDVVRENYRLMESMGLNKQEISDLSAQAFELAGGKNKQVGNFEIRQAFSKVLGGKI